MFGFSVRSDLLAGAGVDLVGAGAGGLTPACASGSGTGSATGGPTKVVGGVTNDPGPG